MGLFRCALALAVVLYHGAGFVHWGVHIGVSAVVCFYIVSGYAMTGLIDRHFSASAAVVPFYCDRFWRLAPQYFTYLAFAAFLIFVLGIRSDLYQSGPLTAENVIAHLSVVPLSAFMYLPEVGRFQFIPQAWSLGTEALFYLSLPFLLVSRWRVYACIVCSLIIFLVAIAGTLDPDAFGFRLLPGVLIFFLTGHSRASSE
jgi:peptidoglycan/LPS O-acetylase OafA/YrhL